MGVIKNVDRKISRIAAILGITILGGWRDGRLLLFALLYTPASTLRMNNPIFPGSYSTGPVVVSFCVLRVFVERDEERDDGQTYWLKAPHLASDATLPLPMEEGLPDLHWLCWLVSVKFFLACVKRLSQSKNVTGFRF
jgi:hypothetical protein